MSAQPSSPGPRTPTEFEPKWLEYVLTLILTVVIMCAMKADAWLTRNSFKVVLVLLFIGGAIVIGESVAVILYGG